jgi:hypothetical protein
VARREKDNKRVDEETALFRAPQVLASRSPVTFFFLDVV